MKTLAHILAAFWVVLVPSAYGANYYVNDGSTNGDVYCSAVGTNSNNGTSPSTPVAGPEVIVSKYDLEPGDTIWIDTGTYYPTNLTADEPGIRILSNDCGSVSSYVTFQGSTNAAAGGTVLNRGGTSSQREVFKIYQSGGIRLRNLHLTGGAHGLYTQSSSNVIVDACQVYGNGDGLFIQATPNTRIRNTTSHHNSGRGLMFYHGSVTVFLENCAIWSNYFSEPVGLKPEIYITDNTALFSMTNTIVQVSGAGHVGIYYAQANMPPYVGDYNDLVALNGAAVGGYGISAAFYTLAAWQAASTQDAHSISLNAEFTGDGHLMSRGGTWSNGTWVVCTTNSPCIDRGNPASTFTNEPAPNGGRINIGAFGNTGQASKTADFDGDGLSDVSECYDYFTNPDTADTDNDGYDDRSELIAGTVATNDTSFFDVDGLPATNRSGFSMTWFGNSGRNYQPQWRTNLISGIWSNCTGLVNPAGQALGSLAGTNGWVTAIDTNSAGKILRFYRIKVTRP